MCDNEEVRIELVQDKEVLSVFAKDWDGLFERAVGAPPYLSRVWVSAFIREGRLGGHPSFLLAWAGKLLVALLALEARRFLGVNIGQPIGTGVPSYLGLLLDPDYPLAVRRLAEVLARDDSIECLYISDLSSEDQATNKLIDELVNNRFLCRRVNRNLCRYIKLGCSYDEYLIRTKDAKRRKKLRYEEKALFTSGKVTVQHYLGKEITPDILERLARIQEQSWMERRGAAVLRQAFYQKLLLDMAKAGFGHVWILVINDEDTAFVYAYVSHKKLNFAFTAFKLGYQQLSPGKILTMHVIRYACKNSILAFDFGHGDAEYKRFWSTDCHQVDRVVVGKGFGGYLLTVFCFAAWQLARIKRLRSLYRWVRSCVLLPMGRRA